MRSWSWLLAVLAALGGSGCGSGSDTQTSQPQIVGCNTLVHEGRTFDESQWCEQGALRIRLTVGQDGGIGSCVDMTCACGCLATAMVCEQPWDAGPSSDPVDAGACPPDAAALAGP